MLLLDPPCRLQKAAPRKHLDRLFGFVRLDWRFRQCLVHQQLRLRQRAARLVQLGQPLEEPARRASLFPSVCEVPSLAADELAPLQVPGLPKAGDTFSSARDAYGAFVRAVLPVYGVGVAKSSSSSMGSMIIKCNRAKPSRAPPGTQPCSYRVEVELDERTGRWIVAEGADEARHSHGPAAQILRDPSWRPRVRGRDARAALGMSQLSGVRKLTTSGKKVKSKVITSKRAPSKIKVRSRFVYILLSPSRSGPDAYARCVRRSARRRRRAARSSESQDQSTRPPTVLVGKIATSARPRRSAASSSSFRAALHTRTRRRRSPRPPRYRSPPADPPLDISLSLPQPHSNSRCSSSAFTPPSPLSSLISSVPASTQAPCRPSPRSNRRSSTSPSIMSASSTSPAPRPHPMTRRSNPSRSSSSSSWRERSGSSARRSGRREEEEVRDDARGRFSSPFSFFAFSLPCTLPYSTHDHAVLLPLCSVARSGSSATTFSSRRPFLARALRLERRCEDAVLARS